MAIKILKEGSQSLINPTRRFICRKCKCEFTAQKADFNKVMQADRPSVSSYNYMTCPTHGCDQMIIWDAHADKDVDPY